MLKQNILIKHKQTQQQNVYTNKSQQNTNITNQWTGVQ